MAAAFVLIQLALPLFIVARPAPRPTDFSWDMFSHARSCSRLDAVARVPGGPWQSVRLDLDFANWAQLSRVFFPSRLDAYASYLCAKLRREERESVELRFVAVCRDDRSGPPVPLVDEHRDYCRERTW